MSNTNESTRPQPEVSTPEVDSNAVKPKGSKWLMWVLGIVILVGIGLGASAKLDPTADWKTYENKDYGFSFKYPGETQLNIEEQPRANSDIALIRISDDVPVSIIGFKKINCEEQKNIIFNNGDSINEKFDEHNNTGIINISLPNKECIKITKLIYLPRNEWLEKYNKQIDQILSTFKFTK